MNFAHLPQEDDQLDQIAPADTLLTDEELSELLKPSEPKSGEFSSGFWSGMINSDIEDPVEWLKALRSNKT